MKKILLILCLGLSLTVFSQEVRYGVHGGANFANLDLEASEGPFTFGINTDVRTSFYVGGFAEFSIKNSEHKLQTGLNLSFNGFKFSQSEPDDFEIESSTRITQLNVPILFKFNAYEGLYLNGGAYFGIIVSAEEKYEETDFFFNESFSETNDISDELKTIDFGLSIGAEYNLPNGLFFELRYNYGLVDISNIEEDEDGSVSFKNRFFNLGIGFKF